ncbi:hypothetical protein [Aeribacillus sp. FSL K6-2833]|uniref:hypothetical protein n=1 Tax=Aeribacillus sp. FSL K6-2833 TaxID=2954611 RepID=UPI0030DC2AC3
MKIVIENTIEQYDKLFSLEEEERENYFRFSMMKPFEKMWNTINVPLKANKPNGYDVIMATNCLDISMYRKLKLEELPWKI